MNELHLFAGAGGGILAGKALGWRCVCAVENNPYRQRVLVQRQNDKILEPFPIWDDVRTFLGAPWRGLVDVVSGGFPCQGVSAAGKGEGLEDSRSGLWGEMARVIGEVQPRFVFVENSPLLVSRGGPRVLSDLASMGYDAVWGVMGAHHVGAPHKRDRIWIVANADRKRRAGRGVCRHGEVTEAPASPPYRATCRPGEECSEDVANTNEAREPQQKRKQSAVGRWLVDGSQDLADAESIGREKVPCWKNGLDIDAGEIGAWHAWGDSVRPGDPWNPEPILGRVADGVAHRLHRVEAIGDGQVPAVAASIWRILSQEFKACSGTGKEEEI